MEERMCGNCKHWKSADGEYGDCDLISNNRQPGTAEIMVDVIDWKLINGACFETAEYFYCNMWKATV